MRKDTGQLLSSPLPTREIYLFWCVFDIYFYLDLVAFVYVTKKVDKIFGMVSMLKCMCMQICHYIAMWGLHSHYNTKHVMHRDESSNYHHLAFIIHRSLASPLPTVRLLVLSVFLFYFLFDFFRLKLVLMRLDLSTKCKHVSPTLTGQRKIRSSCSDHWEGMWYYRQFAEMNNF